MNDFLAPEQPGPTPAPQKNVHVYNVLISYYVELVETESDLQVAMRIAGGKADYKSAEHFLKRLAKLYKMTAFQIPEDLRIEIGTYLNLYSTDFRYGIDLSKRLRTHLEENGIIVLYQDTIIPPFVSAKRMLEEELRGIR